MSPPSRRSWRFHDSTKDFDFWPTLDSVIITDGQEDIPTFAATVVDVAGSIDLDTEDEVYVEIGGTRVFAGHVKGRTLAYRSEAGPRAYDIECQGYTAKLDDSVIDAERARPAESLTERVAWVLSYLAYPVTTGGVSLPTETAERESYGGHTVREALDVLCDVHRLAYYVDVDRDLHLFRSESIAAPFELDDVAPDHVSRFPYSEWRHTEDSVELTNAVYVQGERSQAWVTDAGSIATYGRQERSVNDTTLATSTAVARAGARAIAEGKDPQVDGELTCWEPGLRAGMSFRLTNDLWGFDARTFVVVSVEVTAVDPHDAAGEAFVRTLVRYSDRRRARPGRHRRTKGQATIEDGTPIALTRACLSVVRDRIGYSGSTPNVPIADSVAYASPVPPSHDTITEAAPAYRRPYIFASCPPVFQGGWSGWSHEEQWLEFDPGDLTGVSAIRFTYTVDDPTFTSGRSFVIGVRPAADGPPTGEGQFTELGRCSADGGHFDVPAGVLTASTTNRVCLAPGWSCPRGVETCDGALANGFEGPLGGTAPGGGEYGSGRVSLDAVTAMTRVLAGSGRTPWATPTGSVDGTNATFDLPDWDGHGVPEVRIGGVVLAYDTDYTLNTDAGTVTLVEAPWAGAELVARWSR